MLSLDAKNKLWILLQNVYNINPAEMNMDDRSWWEDIAESIVNNIATERTLAFEAEIEDLEKQVSSLECVLRQTEVELMNTESDVTLE